MVNLAKNILEMLTTASELTLEWSALPKIGSAVLSFREDTQPSDYMDIMKEKSQAAYDAYCRDLEAHSRSDYMGIPDQKLVLDYWEHCMETDTFPNSRDFADFAQASTEESEQMLKFLMGQWLTVPDFTVWLHGIANGLKLNEIAQTLELLPQMDSMIRRMEEGLKNLPGNGRGLARIRLITYQTVMEAKSTPTETLEEDIRNYYKISNNYPTMLSVIGTGRDIPHEAACATLDELLQENKPVIIPGNGGLGKTSLMLREAIRWAETGGIAVWMPLSASEADAVSEAQATEFYRLLTDSTPSDTQILLCIDNPYDGRETLENLRRAWPSKGRIRLLMAERSNRLSMLGDQSKDRLQGWFDNASVLELLGAEDADGEQFLEKDYRYLPLPEEPGRRRRILDACVTAFAKDIEESQREQILGRVLQTYDRPHVSLAELIYRTLFELSRNISKPESVALDWDEWERFIRDALHTDANANMYGVVAAFKLFDTPVTLSFFCRLFKKIDEWDLQSALYRQHMRNQMEPLIYDEDSETLQPKHDVIAELFFLFHKDTVSINRLMERVINEMDGEETEILLDQIVDKREFLHGSAYRIDIHYWDYLNQIRKRMESGKITLGTGGRANLCTGNFWLELQRMRRDGRESADTARLRAYLSENAPRLEPNFTGRTLHGMLKLYMEWGIWEARIGNLEEAEALFRKLLEINPNNIHARTELGRLLAAQRGREADAEAMLRKALEIDPNNLPPLTELGRLLAAQHGREADAEAVFRKALEIDPNNIHARTELGRLLAAQRERQADAEAVYKEALKIKPDNIPTLTELGRLLAQQRGQEADAEAMFRKALEIDPNNLPPQTELGRLLAQQRGREADAEAMFRKALEIDPNNLPPRTELGRLLAQQRGREADAEAMFRKVLEIDPNNIYALTELGRSLAQQRGREADAEAVYKEAMKIKPNNIPTLMMLAKLYENQERFSEAEKLYKKVCQIDPRHRRAKELIDRVRWLKKYRNKSLRWDD